MEKLKPLLPFIVLLFVSLFIINQLYPTASPRAAINLPLTADAITELSKTITRDLGIDLTGFFSSAELKSNRTLLRQVQEELGLEQSIRMLRDGIPGYYWEVRWTKRKPLEGIFSKKGDDQEKVAKDVIDLLRGDVYLRLDTHGRLLEFERKLPDSAKIPSAGPAEAKQLATNFLKRYSMFEQLTEDTVETPKTQPHQRLVIGATTQSEGRIERPQRTDFEYVWSSMSPELKDKILVKVAVAGDIVSRYSVEYEIPERYKKFNTQTIHQIGVAFLYAGIIVIMIVMTFKRFRAYEIGFRLGFIVGIVSAFVLGFQLFITLYRESSGWEIIFPIVLGPLFVGGALVLIWAVSESIVRETWKEKFITIDLLSKGYFVHSRIGQNILRGISLGAGGFALWLALSKAASAYIPLWYFSSNDDTIKTFDTFSPSLYVLAHSFYINTFTFAFFVMFLISLLRRRITSPALLVLAGAFVLGLMNEDHTQPLPVGIALQCAAGAVAVWSFYRFDALATFVALFTFSVVNETAGLFHAGNPAFTESGYTVVTFFGFLFVSSLASLYRKKEITDFDSITPAFAHQITERQRLQQELEIARNVQMSFLPKANPQHSKLDIASRCAPALEVGGDYFDFIELSDNRLGVAVGDVSGKGTQAAFFMTLTKGFLRALAEIGQSPAPLLTRVNKLFYESVDRGVFISMVYGIFDMNRHSLTLARAGHNPVIMRKSQAKDVQIVNPTGLALGLDQGDTFSKSIQEVKISFQPGDLFVFYTDGFPEAMNKTLEEFGEERLCKTVEKLAHQSAAEVMEGIFSEMRQFVGKAKQHDDMTIVVVKTR